MLMIELRARLKTNVAEEEVKLMAICHLADSKFVRNR